MLKVNRDLKFIKVGNKKYSVVYNKIPKAFCPGYYHGDKKKIVLTNKPLSDWEWYTVMMHEVKEIVFHEIEQESLEQLLVEEGSNETR